MQEGRINRKFVEAVREDVTVGLPLFRGKNTAAPPERITDSKARLETFRKISEDGSLNAQRLRVLGIIKRCGPMTIIDLRDNHGIALNIGSGRCSDLYKLGYIAMIGKKTNPETGRPISIYEYIRGID